MTYIEDSENTPREVLVVGFECGSLLVLYVVILLENGIIF